jgi:Flp pilus assembly protein TadD
MHKAEQLAAHIAQTDPAEGHYAQAQIEEKRKDYNSAEQHLRRAWELAPSQAGRAMDLAMFLAKRGRFSESEAMFDQAAHIAPGNAKILFERADTYIKEQRNLDVAKQLLQRYIRAQLTPDDPPRERAAFLLKKIGA